MFKKIILFILLLSVSNLLHAQKTGSFDTLLTLQGAPFNGSVSRTFSYYVPPSYNPANGYKLIVGLNGIGTGTSSGFRDEIQNLSDSLNAIIVCPDGGADKKHNSEFGGAEINIINYAIDTTTCWYSIDTNQIYLTGFSWGGGTTLKYGLDKIYNFKGIIPFNAYNWLTTLSYNYASDMITCICVGTSDGNYSTILQVANNLQSAGATYFLNEMPGIGHTTNFPAFEAEMMECFNFIDSSSPDTSVGIKPICGPDTSVGIKPISNSKLHLKIYPNPFLGETKIEYTLKEKAAVLLEVYNVLGKKIVALANEVQDPGIYNYYFSAKEKGLSSGIFVLKLTIGEEVFTAKILEMQ